MPSPDVNQLSHITNSGFTSEGGGSDGGGSNGGGFLQRLARIPLCKSTLERYKTVRETGGGVGTGLRAMEFGVGLASLPARVVCNKLSRTCPKTVALLDLIASECLELLQEKMPLANHLTEKGDTLRRFREREPIAELLKWMPALPDVGSGFDFSELPHAIPGYFIQWLLTFIWKCLYLMLEAIAAVCSLFSRHVDHHGLSNIMTTDQRMSFMRKTRTSLCLLLHSLSQNSFNHPLTADSDIVDFTLDSTTTEEMPLDVDSTVSDGINLSLNCDCCGRSHRYCYCWDDYYTNSSKVIIDSGNGQPDVAPSEVDAPAISGMASTINFECADSKPTPDVGWENIASDTDTFCIRSDTTVSAGSSYNDLQSPGSAQESTADDTALFEEVSGHARFKRELSVPKSASDNYSEPDATFSATALCKVQPDDWSLGIVVTSEQSADDDNDIDSLGHCSSSEGEYTLDHRAPRGIQQEKAVICNEQKAISASGRDSERCNSHAHKEDNLQSLDIDKSHFSDNRGQNCAAWVSAEKARFSASLTHSNDDSLGCWAYSADGSTESFSFNDRGFYVESTTAATTFPTWDSKSNCVLSGGEPEVKGEDDELGKYTYKPLPPEQSSQEGTLEEAVKEDGRSSSKLAPQESEAYMGKTRESNNTSWGSLDFSEPWFAEKPSGGGPHDENTMVTAKYFDTSTPIPQVGDKFDPQTVDLSADEHSGTYGTRKAIWKREKSIEEINLEDESIAGSEVIEPLMDLALLQTSAENEENEDTTTNKPSSIADLTSNSLSDLSWQELSDRVDDIDKRFSGDFSKKLIQLRDGVEVLNTAVDSWCGAVDSCTDGAGAAAALEPLTLGQRQV